MLCMDVETQEVHLCPPHGHPPSFLGPTGPANVTILAGRDWRNPAHNTRLRPVRPLSESGAWLGCHAEECR
jgi:hypothetical protein